MEANGKSYAAVDCRLLDENDPVLRRVAGVLETRVAERSLRAVGSAPRLTVELGLDPSLAEDGYRIEESGADRMRVLGCSPRAALFGIGKLVRDGHFTALGFEPGGWRGESAPDCPVRMIYLATHFRNWYEAAPAAEVARYVEDLALWGYNAFEICYPTEQFGGLDDPLSETWLAQFLPVLVHARSLGLHVSTGLCPNSVYRGFPVSLRATPVQGHRRGNFGELICPAKPGAVDYLSSLYGRLLDRFQESGMDYVVFWPYDLGGCGCSECWPWGSRGFPEISRRIAEVVRERFPECRLILSTWCFENEDDSGPDGEWSGLDQYLAARRPWFHYLMADGHDDYFPARILRGGVPGGLPLLNFPEISMFGQSPWGGYGANPAPKHFQRLWDRIRDMAAGGSPYSEGIYEDINKAIIAGFYWDRGRKAEDTVREYCAGYFGPETTPMLVEAVELFEANHERTGIGPSAHRALALVQQAEALLPPAVREGWRWRILALRARIDCEIHGRAGKLEGPILRECFGQLTDLYHAEHVHSMPLRPPQVS